MTTRGTEDGGSTVKLRVRHFRWRSTAIAVASVLLVGVGLAPLAPAESAVAVDGSGFDPGFIISDELFFNSSTMDEQQVQAFLEAKMPGCTAPAGNPGCLRNYRTDSNDRPANQYCTSYPRETGQLASHIIWGVARACNINPQVLLVLLEKEQGLLSNDDPSPTRYRIATGYGCPDTAACDTAFYGFFNQVYSAARQFNRYADPAQGFNYQPGRNNTIQWHPDGARCGSSTVFIRNKATAALYNYTPYRPNDAALANMYGTGDSCSSYGNRNFYRIYSDWFGSPIISQPVNAYVRAVYKDVLLRDPSDAERIPWARALMGGMTRGQVAGGFVNSDEFRLAKIDQAYREVLGRGAEEPGRTGWLDGMRRGALSPDDAYRTFMQSDEYYNNSGGTLETFVAAVYQRILKREAIAPEIQYWVGIANQYGRSTVVNRIWISVETAEARVADMYLAYLGRTPDRPGLVMWGQLNLANGDSWVRAQLLNSAEYWNRAGLRYP